MPSYKAKHQIGDRSFDNVNIEVPIMETLRWEYLRKLFPNCIKELEVYCKKNEITFEDLWLLNIEIYEFFDEREIITYVAWCEKHHSFYSRHHTGLHRSTINNIMYFKGRVEAQVCGLLNSMKKREKQILFYLEEKKKNGNR